MLRSPRKRVKDIFNKVPLEPLGAGGSGDAFFWVPLVGGSLTGFGAPLTGDSLVGVSFWGIPGGDYPGAGAPGGGLVRKNTPKRVKDIFGKLRLDALGAGRVFWVVRRGVVPAGLAPLGLPVGCTSRGAQGLARPVDRTSRGTRLIYWVRGVARGGVSLYGGPFRNSRCDFLHTLGYQGFLKRVFWGCGIPGLRGTGWREYRVEGAQGNSWGASVTVGVKKT